MSGKNIAPTRDEKEGLKMAAGTYERVELERELDGFLAEAMNDGRPALKVEALTKRFPRPEGKRRGFWRRRPKFAALAAVTFTVEKSEIFGLIGMNGSGKSTLIRIISTLLAPDEGQVGVFGVDVEGNPGRVRELINRVAVDAAFFKVLSGLIDFYILARIGDLWMAAEDYNSAINTYHNALQAPHLGDPLYINIRIGDAYKALGDLPTAIVAYEDVYNRTGNNATKAQMKRKVGEAHIVLGQTDLGYAAYQVAFTNYPFTNDAYLALVELVNAEIPVDELLRGLVDFDVGQYGLAIDAFVRYLDAHPDDHPDTVHYYWGLSLRAIGENEAAIEVWRQQIEEHFKQDSWANAFEEIAYTQW